MKPFYSIDELADLLGRDELEVADGLKANSTLMIYNGDVADLSEWYGRRARRGENGSVIIRAGGSPLPSSSDVMVASDALPSSWQAAIEEAEAKATRKAATPNHNEAVEQPNWPYWINLAEVELGQAVELSCGVQPGSLNSYAAESYVPVSIQPLLENISHRLSVACSHIEASKLTVRLQVGEIDFFHSPHPDRCFISLADFRAWGELLPNPFTFPDDFPKVGVALSLGATRWPWGNHETALLRQLAAAGDRFWRNYDPKDPSTANTSVTVSEWLKGEGVPKRVAQVMAQILRADGLKPGPR